MKNIASIICAILVALLINACSKESSEKSPAAPGNSPPSGTPLTLLEGRLPPGPWLLDYWPQGTSSWQWASADPTGNGTLLAGSAALEIIREPGTDPDTGIFRWTFNPPFTGVPGQNVIVMTPDDLANWLPLRTSGAAWETRGAPLPLPRLPLDSSQYSHLLELLTHLTTSHFGAVVCHWPQLPIPVRVVPALSGEVDLAACLLEAVARWNQDEPFPWFQVDNSADWGVRLVHFPGATLHPTMQARITRLDDQDNPLRINIIVGDDYDRSVERTFAIRAFVHELGHALFLWGHSLDQNHVLWGAAPPLVNYPSLDERKAARLWHGLPQGLDLNDYLGSLTEP